MFINSSECSFFGYDANQTGTTSYINATVIVTLRTILVHKCDLETLLLDQLVDLLTIPNVSDGRYKKEVKERSRSGFHQRTKAGYLSFRCQRFAVILT